MPPGKGINGPLLHPRGLSVQLLSGLRCAGVSTGLDSEIRIWIPDDPLARKRSGFLHLDMREYLSDAREKSEAD